MILRPEAESPAQGQEAITKPFPGAVVGAGGHEPVPEQNRMSDVVYVIESGHATSWYEQCCRNERDNDDR